MLHCLHNPNAIVFYASAEEPIPRFLARAFRLGFDTEDCKQIFRTRFVGSRETEILSLIEQIRKYKPTLIIFDSIRRFKHRDVKTNSFLTHGPEVIAEIIDIAEELKCCCVVVARLTKEGKIAGNEDMGYDIDCVLRLERYSPKKKLNPLLEKKSKYVTLRCDGKNRMGPKTKSGGSR